MMAASCLINWVYRDTCPRILASSTAQTVTQDFHGRRSYPRAINIFPLLFSLRNTWKRRNKLLSNFIRERSVPLITQHVIRLNPPSALIYSQLRKPISRQPIGLNLQSINCLSFWYGDRVWMGIICFQRQVDREREEFKNVPLTALERLAEDESYKSFEYRLIKQ